MKALCVTLNYTEKWGGVTTSVSSFARALDADILSFTLRSLIPEALHGNGITHIPVPDSFVGRHYCRPLTRDLRVATELASGYDVIVCHMLYRYHNIWVKRLQKPFFVVPHGSLDPYVLTYRRVQKELWFRFVGAQYFRGAEAVIFATNREQQKAIRGIGADKARVISWEVKESADEGTGRTLVRKRLGIRENEKMLLLIGRLHSSKRPLEVIEAFAQAAEENMHLVLVGPEEQYSVRDLIIASERFGARNVHVLGAIYGDDKWDYYRAADGYISLSEKENFGYTLAEAMSFGLPLILSPGNDLGHDLVGEECSWMLKTNSREEAVGAIRAFGNSDNDTLRKMGEQGKSWISRNATTGQFRSRLRKLVFSQHGKPVGPY